MLILFKESTVSLGDYSMCHVDVSVIVMITFELFVCLKPLLNQKVNQ